MIIVVIREEVSMAHYFLSCKMQEESSIVRSGLGLATHQQMRQREKSSLNSPA